jgi:importin-7
MLPSLDNFVSYGTDVFRARADYRQKAIDIYETALTSDHLGEHDRVNGCKLAESLLLNLRGHIDDVSLQSPLTPTLSSDFGVRETIHSASSSLWQRQ